MLKAVIPAKHAVAVEAFVEDQTIMTCEVGQNDDGDLTICNHHGDMPEQFYAFIEELLMYLPFGTEIKLSKFFK